MPDYTIQIRYTKTYNRYIRVSAGSEEEAVQKVYDASDYPTFDAAMTHNFDTEDVDLEAYLCNYNYDKIVTLEDMLESFEEEEYE